MLIDTDKHTILLQGGVRTLSASMVLLLAGLILTLCGFGLAVQNNDLALAVLTMVLSCCLVSFLSTSARRLKRELTSD